MNINMVCQRDYILRTRTGHTIQFFAGVPTPVPESIYAEALAKNIVPVKPKSEDEAVFTLINSNITGTLRDALVYQTLQQVAERNQPEDFTGGGVPKAAVISGEVGISLSASEVNRYWTNYRQMLSENETLPTHPQMEMVRELQSLSTRKQMEEFAADHGISVPRAKGKTLKEFKELLMHHTINQVGTPPAVDGEYTKPSTLMED